jgi:putative SOS response-associated peptidase YedK
MCNEYEIFTSWEEYAAMMAAVDLGIPTRQTELDLPQSAGVHISEIAPVMRAAGNVVELAPMRFGFPPEKGRGPVFNYRSEGRHFGNSLRCLIPATAFFEFTGSRYPKTRHRFTPARWPWLAIAGLWREGAAGQPPSFTMLTTEPGPDIAPIHDRQIVILPPENWSAWLSLSRPEAELLRPLPEGFLRHEVVQPAKPPGTLL